MHAGLTRYQLSYISRLQIFIIKHQWENFHKADMKVQIFMFELYNSDFFLHQIILNINTSFTLLFTEVKIKEKLKKIRNPRSEVSKLSLKGLEAIFSYLGYSVVTTQLCPEVANAAR